MNLEINLEIRPSSICLDELIVLSLLYEKQYEQIREVQSKTFSNVIGIIETLEEKGYVKILNTLVDEEEGVFYPEAVSLRDKALELVENRDIKLNDLVDQFRALFPTGYRGDLAGCKTKLKTFIRKNKKFDAELILRATQEYNLFVTKTNTFRRQAHYFIIKDGVSDLARYCEALLNHEEIGTNVTIDNATVL